MPNDDTTGQPQPSGVLKRAGRGATARHKPTPRPDPVEKRADARPEKGRLKRQRRRVADQTIIDPRLVQPGYSYEWKSASVMGKPEPGHIQDLKENHWREVPADRVPGAIVKNGGLVLMERPAYLTEDARQEDYEIARDQVHGVTDRLRNTPKGHLTRDHQSVERITGVKRTFGTPIVND